MPLTRLRFGFILCVIAAALAAACSGGGGGPAATSTLHPQRKVCEDEAPGTWRCFAHIWVDSAGADVAAPSPSGWGAKDLMAAYPHYGGGAGTGTVAIVDAYDSPTAEADLAAYRKQYGLPDCTSANGCFQKLNQSGKATPLPGKDTNPKSNWGIEIALDLDMVSAICPTCKILLIEANTNNYADLGAGNDSAVTLGANAVSDSFGGKEFAGETSLDSHFNHPGTFIAVATGDTGNVVTYPSAYGNVTAVGGTVLSGSGTTWTETAWPSGGSGCSQYEAKPSWQTDTGCKQRTTADVSAVADGLAVYYNGSWTVVGGTSAATPIFAAWIVAGSWSGLNAQYFYLGATFLRDITSGSNGSCGSYLCKADKGYDGPTGLGTPSRGNPCDGKSDGAYCGGDLGLASLGYGYKCSSGFTFGTGPNPSCTADGGAAEGGSPSPTPDSGAPPSDAGSPVFDATPADPCTTHADGNYCGSDLNMPNRGDIYHCASGWVFDFGPCSPGHSCSGGACN